MERRLTEEEIASYGSQAGKLQRDLFIRQNAFKEYKKVESQKIKDIKIMIMDLLIMINENSTDAN